MAPTCIASQQSLVVAFLERGQTVEEDHFRPTGKVLQNLTLHSPEEEGTQQLVQLRGVWERGQPR